jgi:hypothetical protein
MIQKMARRFRAVPKVVMADGGNLSDPFSGSSSVSVSSVRARKNKFDGTTQAPTNLPTDRVLPGISPKFQGKTAEQLQKEQLSSGLNLNGVAPYVSNIVNSFRRAPRPAYPTMNSSPALSKINMDDARNQVGREISSSNTGADRNLDSNTAASVKLFNSGRKLNALSGINEYEKNINSNIANQQSQMDWQTQMGNNAKIDNYNNEITSSNIANQNNQSANLANAADKFVAIGNEKQKADVERDKTRTLSTMFSPNGPNGGVFGRERLRIANSGGTDPILGRPLTDIEVGQMTTSNNNTTPSVSSMQPITQQQSTTVQPDNSTPATNGLPSKMPDFQRVPFLQKQSAGYPYNNTTLPKTFTNPNNPLFKTKFKMGGNLSRMKKVKY